MFVNRFVDVIYDSALALVYPRGCAVCGAGVESRHDGPACDDCWNAARLFCEDDTVCWKCGVLAVAQVVKARPEDVRCRRCDEESFTAARACGTYEGALRASVLALKSEPHVSRRLARLMFGNQQRAPVKRANLIIPVPLHPDRERERGFNQANLLARELSRLTKLQLNEHAIIRDVHTERHRAGMDSRARRDSVENAFRVRRPQIIAGRRVLLVDDVFTTGATVSACAAVLKEAGAEEVFVLTVARA